MDINSKFQLGALTLQNRLIQGPLAGFSCAPFRRMYSLFQRPAYCVSEMISAHDLLWRQPPRFVYRDPAEGILAYQLSGHDPDVMAKAAQYLESIGADLIDINCGCPKAKIRKKGAGSALLAKPDRIIRIIEAMKSRIHIPVTAKIRLQNTPEDVQLAKAIEEAGADGLVVHGRRWQDDYDVSCNRQQIAAIKQSISIPVIANGDITDAASLQQMIEATGCDAYMIARAGTGRPWLYQDLAVSELDESRLETVVSLSQLDVRLQKRNAVFFQPNMSDCVDFFMLHLQGLAQLQNEHQAVLQSKTLVRYYLKPWLSRDQLQTYYTLDDLSKIEQYLRISSRAYDES
ncbi:MAG: tRNA-dihydrouridine synthase family protein [Gammaproteobacteria bacterium]|nr:tRNA-dihydrouridine synthase family protein [Gammaproteobacteria bacterium]